MKIMEIDHSEVVKNEFLELYSKYVDEFSAKVTSKWGTNTELKKSQRMIVENRFKRFQPLLLAALKKDFCTTWNNMKMGELLNDLQPFIRQAMNHNDSDYVFQVNVVDQTRATRNFLLTQKIAKLGTLIAWDQTFLKDGYEICAEERRELEDIHKRRNKCMHNLNAKLKKMKHTIDETSMVAMASLQSDYEERQ